MSVSMPSSPGPIARAAPLDAKHRAATVAHAAVAPGRSAVARTAIKQRLRIGPDAPGCARRLVDILRLAPATKSIVELLVSELVTNAVVHSGLPEDAEFSIALTRQGECIAAEVWDRGGGFAWQGGADDLIEPGGLGLVLVDRLTHRWGIRREAGGAVWFVYLDPTAA
jgi:two-component sensor histidine kinase